MASRLIPEIETERLLLRGPLPGDVDAWAAIISDPDVQQYLPQFRSPPPIHERAERGLNAIRTGWEQTPLTGISWLVALKDGGRLIGRLSAAPNSAGKMERSADPEFAYIYGQAYWGRGYATEAARAAIRYSFDHFNWPRVVAATLPGNAASQRVLGRLGFIAEGDVDYYELSGAEETIMMVDPIVSFFSLARERFDLGDAVYRVRG